MKSLNQKIIVCGIALLLFGMNVAIVSQSTISYVFSGLGLFFVVIGCFSKKKAE